VPSNAFRLETLGGLVLLAPDGIPEPSLSTRRRKLAVLAVLALAARPVERDTLIGLFWPEQAEDRARHSLSDTLSHLRRVLGRDVLVTAGSTVALDARTRLVVDALALNEAVRAERWADAVAVYAGPFLGTTSFAGASTSFEHWADGERARLQRLFVTACEAECLALMRKRAFARCAAIAARWLEAAPYSADAALYRLNALKGPGTPEARQEALAEHDRLTRWLATEYETTPAPAVEDLVGRLREQHRALAPGAAATPPADTPAAPPDRREPPATGAPAGQGSISESYTWAIPSPPPSRSVTPVVPPVVPPAVVLPPRVRRRRGWRVVEVVGILLMLTGAWAWYARDTPSGGRPPVIAIAAVYDAAGDTAASWQASGLTQMIAAKLGRSPSVGVVAPERVRFVRRRAELAEQGPLELQQLRDVGRRLGASWVVSGGLVRGDSMLLFELNVHDVHTGRAVRVDAVTGTTLLTLADAAAARLLDAAGAAGPGPRLADVETANLEAYEHYVRARELLDEGRHSDGRDELDRAIALDSGFVSALRERARLAVNDRDGDVVARLAAVFPRYADRATEWDRVELALHTAFQRGEHSRSEALGRALVAHYPSDPRAYQLLRDVYVAHGRWADAERTVLAQLTLDSLATAAGRGACVPCSAYAGLAEIRALRGDLPGAEQALRRLLTLQPDLASAWSSLGAVLAYQGRDAEAMESVRRALALDGESRSTVVLSTYWQVLLMTRQLDAADSLAARWAADTMRSSEPRRIALDVQVMLARERGQYRRSTRLLQAAVREFPTMERLLPLVGDNMARVGDYAGARRYVERISHYQRRTPPPGAPLVTSLEGDRARDFAGNHATLADLIAPAGDTVLLLAMADSIERFSGRSYAGEDWGLHHHVRGLVALRAHRWDDAERALRQARWGVAGFTRTLTALAEVQLAQRKPAAAVATLRDAYKTRPLFRARHLPRSELDYRMALAMSAAGMPDSARIYGDRVRRAWRDADPEVRQLLAGLP
jgi:DNA-binding SARP family transcriptional activator/tetratricopeptide (TPR) repeat protein